MNHSVFGRKLSRTKNERKRLFSNLIRDLIFHGKIITSRAKAKAVQPLVEKLVTKAKRGSDADRRNILAILPYGEVVDTLLADAKDRFSQRNSGFTRVVRMGVARSDNSEEAMLSFVDEGIQRVPQIYEKKVKENTGDVKDKKEPMKPIKKTKIAKKSK